MRTLENENTVRELWPACLHPRHFFLRLVQCSILLAHLSKIIRHNEEKQPLLNKVKNTDLDPVLLLCCTGTEGQVTALWNHVRRAITHHKSLTHGLKNTGWRRQQRLLFVSLLVALCRTAFHHGFLLHSTVFLYQAYFVLGRKRADALRHMIDNLCVSSFRLPSAVVTPPRIWVMANIELTYSPSRSCAWHTVISVIDICPGWQRRVTRRRNVTSWCGCIIGATRLRRWLRSSAAWTLSTSGSNGSAVDDWPHNDRVWSRYCRSPTSAGTSGRITSFSAPARRFSGLRSCWKSGHGRRWLGLSSPLTQHGVYKRDSRICKGSACFSWWGEP